MNIALPNQILAFVEEQAIAAGFSNASEYVYHLVLREQERLAQQQRAEALLLEGLDGEAIEATDDWWNQSGSR